MKRLLRTLGAALSILSAVPLLAVCAGGTTAVATPAPKLTLAVIGDYGCQTGSNCPASPANQTAVANLVHSWNADSIITLGDNSYENGNAASVAADQAPYAADIAAGKFYPTPGNHDWLNGSIDPSTNVFHRPPHYVAHVGGGLLDLFVTDMNSQDPDGDSATSRQADQYRADVAASKATWKITTDHQAFYSSGEHGTNEYTHWAILPQIDLFLSGHDHDFEHLTVDGKNFVVNGVGGRNRYKVCAKGCVPGSLWHDDQNFGAVRLTVTSASILVEFAKVDGQVLYSFQLDRSGGVTRSASSAPSNASIDQGSAANAQPRQLQGTSVALPIRAAFYYPWFPEAWAQQGMNPFTKYHPTAGFYDSSDANTVKKQIEEMQYAHLDAGIASWWGRQTPTDGRVPQLLKLGADAKFHWALLYEPEGNGDPSSKQIDSDLRYMRTHYANNPTYLRMNGRFVVLVYADPNDGCGMTRRWRQAKQIGAYVMLKVFPGYQSCPDQPDGWYQYSPDVGSVSVQGYSTDVSPGFSKANEPSPRLPRDVQRWRTDVRQMVASKAPFQLVTSFNEWGEGTAVELASEWSDGTSAGAYLQVLHEEIPARQGSSAADGRPIPLVWLISAPALVLAVGVGVTLARWGVHFPHIGG